MSSRRPRRHLDTNPISTRVSSDLNGDFSATQKLKPSLNAEYQCSWVIEYGPAPQPTGALTVGKIRSKIWIVRLVELNHFEHEFLSSVAN